MHIDGLMDQFTQPVCNNKLLQMMNNKLWSYGYSLSNRGQCQGRDEKYLGIDRRRGQLVTGLNEPQREGGAAMQIQG